MAPNAGDPAKIIRPRRPCRFVDQAVNPDPRTASWCHFADLQHRQSIWPQHQRHLATMTVLSAVLFWQLVSFS
jgi:hypothetical protein